LGTIEKEMSDAMSNANEQILAQALKIMPNTFTSYDFAIQARKLGHLKLNDGGVYKRFLLKSGLIRTRPKVWHKTPPAINILEEESQPKIPFPPFEYTACPPKEDIDDAIALLKANGYRISKKSEQWIEV